MASKTTGVIRANDHTVSSIGQPVFRRHDLSEVNLALFNDVKSTRTILRDSLRKIGFRPLNTKIVGVLGNLRSAVRQDGIDMLILEADRQPQAVHDLVRAIRSGTLGSNPFLVISIVTWRPDKERIVSFLKAGADDVIVMPASVGFASERVDSLIDNRHKFVVTTKYLGPDRRLRSRTTVDELGTILVPNGLRFKTMGDESAKPNGARLRRIGRVVDDHRLRRMTVRLEALSGQLESAFREQPDARPEAEDMRELPELVSQIALLARDGGRMKAAELIASLRAVMQAIEGAAEMHANMFALLQVYGQALLALQRGDKAASELVVRAVRTAAKVVGDRTRRESGVMVNAAIRI